MSKIKEFAQLAFKKHPIIFNSILYGSLFFTAECSQQIFTKKLLPDKPEPLDKPTLARFAFFGTGVQGPLLTVWYRWLDRTVPGTTMKVIAKKVILDQFFMTPQLYATFFIVMSILEGEEDIFKEMRQKFVPAFTVSCFFWIPAQCINFLLIPPAFRVAYVGSCALAWVNILCWIKHQKY